MLVATELRVNDTSDPVYQSLLKDPTYYHDFQYLDLPIRLDFTPSRSGKGLVLSFGSTQSYWLSGRYRKTGYGKPATEGSVKTPSSRFYLSQELHVGWIFPLARGWQADSLLFGMADLVRMSKENANRMGLGLELCVTMGK